MREIVSVHVGQCGLQMGLDFWEGALQEHSIQPDLTCSNPDLAGSCNTYFEEVDGSRFVPRSVMVDLEPGVVNSISASPYGDAILRGGDSTVFSTNGAGNCWASGFYSEGAEVIEETMEKIRY